MVTWNRPTDNADVNRVILRERETKYSVKFQIFLCADRALCICICMGYAAETNTGIIAAEGESAAFT